MTGLVTLCSISDDNRLLLTVTVLVVALRLPGHGPCALPAGDAAVRLRGEADVVLVRPGEAGGVDHNALTALRQTFGHYNREDNPVGGEQCNSHLETSVILSY